MVIPEPLAFSEGEYQFTGAVFVHSGWVKNHLGCYNKGDCTEHKCTIQYSLYVNKILYNLTKSEMLDYSDFLRQKLLKCCKCLQNNFGIQMNHHRTGST